MSFCVISLGTAFISTHAVHCTCAWLSSLCCHQDIKIIDDRLSPCLPRFSLLPVWSDFFISGCSTSLCFALSSSAFSVLGCSKNFPAALWQLWSAVILQECSWNMMLSNSSSAMLHCSETQAHHTCLLSACKDICKWSYRRKTGLRSILTKRINWQSRVKLSTLLVCYYSQEAAARPVTVTLCGGLAV